MASVQFFLYGKCFLPSDHRQSSCFDSPACQQQQQPVSLTILTLFPSIMQFNFLLARLEEADLL
jgi:hypothetical protein